MHVMMLVMAFPVPGLLLFVLLPFAPALEIYAVVLDWHGPAGHVRYRQDRTR